MKFIKVKKLFDIRWLSRLEAVEAIVRGYIALVAYLADRACTEGDAVCEGLHKQMTTYRFVLTGERRRSEGKGGRGKERGRREEEREIVPHPVGL